MPETWTTLSWVWYPRSFPSQRGVRLKIRSQKNFVLVKSLRCDDSLSAEVPILDIAVNRDSTKKITIEFETLDSRSNSCCLR